MATKQYPRFSSPDSYGRHADVPGRNPNAIHALTLIRDITGVELPDSYSHGYTPRHLRAVA